VIEHFGRKCRGAAQDPATLEINPCGFRFRLKLCHSCGAENDLTARCCERCSTALVDADAKLKQAKLSKNAHVLTPERITFDEKLDKNSNPYLEIRYYDYDGKYISEHHFFSNPIALKRFNVNFLRSHLKRPELAYGFASAKDVVKYQVLFRLPAFVIARKQDKFWKVTEKVFAEEL
jgi:DNA repair protein RadD